MDEYDVQYFALINEEEKEQANRLGELLDWLYKPKSVIDVGCATGLYLKPFLDHGKKILGIDFSKSVIEESVLQVPDKFIKVSDITTEQPSEKADLAMTIEVFEHIDKKFAETCVKYITKCAPLIFFTAAQPGQGGVGHINCQPKVYWEKLFMSEGFNRDDLDEKYIKLIMSNGYHMGWLINNLMVFKKTDLARS